MISQMYLFDSKNIKNFYKIQKIIILLFFLLTSVLFCAIIYIIVGYAPVAQLDRVFGYEPKGRGFESLLAYQKNRQVRLVLVDFLLITYSLFT